MTRRRALALAGLALLLGPGPAAALPPPMSPEELARASDVIALVRVLAVACTGVLLEPRTGERLRTFHGWLQVLESTKGTTAGHTLVVAWQEVPRMPGPWTVPYFPGEETRTHLVWNAAARVWESTWWNAKEAPPRRAGRPDLPEAPGRVNVAPAAGA